MCHFLRCNSTGHLQSGSVNISISFMFKLLVQACRIKGFTIHKPVVLTLEVSQFFVKSHPGYCTFDYLQDKALRERKSTPKPDRALF